MQQIQHLMSHSLSLESDSSTNGASSTWLVMSCEYYARPWSNMIRRILQEEGGGGKEEEEKG